MNLLKLSAKWYTINNGKIIEFIVTINEIEQFIQIASLSGEAQTYMYHEETNGQLTLFNRSGEQAGTIVQNNRQLHFTRIEDKKILYIIVWY